LFELWVEVVEGQVDKVLLLVLAVVGGLQQPKSSYLVILVVLLALRLGRVERLERLGRSEALEEIHCLAQ